MKEDTTPPTTHPTTPDMIPVPTPGDLENPSLQASGAFPAGPRLFRAEFPQSQFDDPGEWIVAPTMSAAARAATDIRGEEPEALVEVSRSVFVALPG